MTLISGNDLDPKRFFGSGAPIAQASSFDLTIGTILDQKGSEVQGHYTLKPGHMVQVVSAEVFNLDDNVTGHVTYKTSMTRIGIWALTVGIVDPGWKSPISTTLLNFSRKDYTIHPGDAFLRVSFFEHSKISKSKLRNAMSLPEYYKQVQKIAASNFSQTFLNSDEIAVQAGNKAMGKMRNSALFWVTLMAGLFALLQFLIQAFAPVATDFIRPKRFAAESELQTTKEALHRAQLELEAMKISVNQLNLKTLELERNAPQAPPTVPLPKQ